MFDNDFKYKYCPLLSISPSEIAAFKELPSQDKDLILPVFPLSSWTTAKLLSDAINKVQSSVGSKRYWIADIDYECFEERQEEKYREVHREIKRLAEPSNGYSNWINFLLEHENLIPCIQKRDVTTLSQQIQKLRALNRGMVLILTLSDIKLNTLVDFVPELAAEENVLIILDLGQINASQLEHSEQILSYLKLIQDALPKALISLSSTSFPDSFGGYFRGTKTIYERALYDRVKQKFDGLIYSDRGSARATKLTGGGGPPPPRIDYATKTEWHFIRKEFEEDFSELVGEDRKDAQKKEKKKLYTQIAKLMMAEAYWEDLSLYSNYLIELTGKGDDFGINSPQKATAVRINKHLHTQLHYDSQSGTVDTDEDWVD